MTCSGCGIALTKETKHKDRLLCKPCYANWHREYCKNRYPDGSLKQRAYYFNRNRAGAHIKESDLEAIILRQCGECKTCGDDIGTVPWEIDHIIPVSVGGSHSPANLQILCKRCNRAKDNGSMREFELWISRISKRLTPATAVT